MRFYKGWQGWFIQFWHLLTHFGHISCTLTTNDDETIYGCAMCGPGAELCKKIKAERKEMLKKYRTATDKSKS